MSIISRDIFDCPIEICSTNRISGTGIRDHKAKVIGDLLPPGSEVILRGRENQGEQGVSHKQSGTSEVTLYLAFYYTLEYASAVGDVRVAINNEVATLNAIMEKNDFPARFDYTCLTRLDLDESLGGSQRLQEVKDNRGEEQCKQEGSIPQNTVYHYLALNKT